MAAPTAVPAPDADGKLTQKLAAASLASEANGKSNGHAHAHAHANGNGAAENGNDDEDDDDDEGEDGADGADGAAKKKSGKKGKKKSGAAKKKAKAAKERQANGLGIKQTEPEPTIPLSQVWPQGGYPEGETVPYDESKFDDARKRTTLEELRERERMLQDGEGNSYDHIRKASEVHRQVRKYARATIKPGMSMTEIAELIEDKVRLLAGEDPDNPFEAGMGFPLGLSLNECAAHYTPNAGDKRSELWKQWCQRRRWVS